MSRFRIHDLKTLEVTPASPGAMRVKVGELVLNSTVCRAKVEVINADTGEYRIILQGSLDKEETKFE